MIRTWDPALAIVTVLAGIFPKCTGPFLLPHLFVISHQAGIAA